MEETDNKEKYSSDLKRLDVRASRIRTSAAPNNEAEKSGIFNKMFSARTVPRYSAGSVAAAAASAPTQFRRTSNLESRDCLTSSDRSLPAAIPSFPERYWRSIAMRFAIQTVQSKP